MPLVSTTTLAPTRTRLDFWQGGIMVFLLALLGVFILYPVLQVLWISLSDEQGNLTLLHFANFFRRPLFREAIRNTLWSGLLVVCFSALLALPLAYVLARYEFRGKLLLQTAATLPLVIPPFVGAVALQLILGRSGMVNLLLMDWFEITIPFMEGLNGVVLVQTLHFFPFILQHSGLALQHRSSLEEMAQNLGCTARLFRRVTLPLMLPGFVAGSLLTFIRAIDDLGTPLMLNYKNLLAPQAYLRITTIGMDDVDGYVVCVVLVILSLACLFTARKYVSLSEYATVHRAAPITRPLRGTTLALVWLVIGLVLGISLLPPSALFCCLSPRCELHPLPTIHARQLQRDLVPRAALRD
jgi:iron(III) transport system permease protein